LKFSKDPDLLCDDHIKKKRKKKGGDAIKNGVPGFRELLKS